MRKMLAFLTGLALLCGTALVGAPAMATQSPANAGEENSAAQLVGEPESFVIFGEQPEIKAGKVSRADVEQSFKAQNQKSAIEVASPARAALAWDVYSSWKDNKAKTTAIRWGSSTWGWRHVQKHNVSLKMIQKTTKFPKTRTVDGNRIIYTTPANKYTCWLGFACKIDKSATVLVLVANQRAGDGKHKGVITAYCTGTKVCPNWVREVA
ncbi:hypothetical protein [Glutamicibacter sp. AOP5-A2-18]|uniref:hypothetical protein n=1 Tax=Glutamicibacter sp. AOP5-A2-18 TaxID=3457656 RepID=UPI004033487E